MNCRHCNESLRHVFLDLIFSPPSNSYLKASDLKKAERYYPLKLFTCESCWLVQTADYVQTDELFNHEYAYFSSVSSGWMTHALNYTDMITERLGLDSNSMVIEVASNDGYLLRNFVAAGIPCLGIEPTDSTADAAEKLGITVLRDFFGDELAQKLVKDGCQADLILGNNVYAHVPAINDFTEGLKSVLKRDGTVTLEFPHLLQLLKYNQFDTVYHEHFSYLSLFSVCQIFQKAGLRVFDVEKLPTHGGSLRIYGCHNDDERTSDSSVSAVLEEEVQYGMRNLDVYVEFQARADLVKNNLLKFLIEEKQKGKRVVGYGAAAKGCTLLNYAGIKPDLLSFVCDASSSKQGKYLPGSHIPILHPDAIQENKPDTVLILPWNIKNEVVQQLSYIREWGGEFVVAVPEIQVL